MRTANASLLLIALVCTSTVQAAGNVYCCADERGKQMCGDILPAACIGRAYREINQSGMTIRQVEAPLTAEERNARKLEEKRQKEAEAAEREQRRLDAALLQTYGSVADIDMMKTRAETDVMLSIVAANEKIDEARLRRKKFENEAEFYKSRALPPDVEKGLKDADFQIQAQETLISSKQKDLETIRAKYDEDKRRYLDLKTRRTRSQ